MAITREEVLHVARLARLAVTGDEADRLRERLFEEERKNRESAERARREIEARNAELAAAKAGALVVTDKAELAGFGPAELDAAAQAAKA